MHPRQALLTVFNTPGSFLPMAHWLVGPYNVVESVNETVAIYNKVGNLQYEDTISNFLGGSPNTGDPHFVYNPYVNRFFFVIIGQNSNKDVWVGASVDSNMFDGWYWYDIDIGDTVGNVWCDYPQIGFNAVATFVTCNMFDFSNNFQTAEVTTFSTAQLSAGGGISWWDNWGFHEEAATYSSP
jgi:hypothetical protein